MSQVIVLDTHAWYWWVNLEHGRLSSDILSSIETAPRVGVSPVSCYELALASPFKVLVTSSKIRRFPEPWHL